MLAKACSILSSTHRIQTDDMILCTNIFQRVFRISYCKGLFSKHNTRINFMIDGRRSGRHSHFINNLNCDVSRSIRLVHEIYSRRPSKIMRHYKDTMSFTVEEYCQSLRYPEF
jgi:hypothetical protein